MHEESLQTIKKHGHKLTKTRSLIIALLTNRKKPLTAGEILNELSEIGLRVNKTTVYRELEFLMKERIVNEVQFEDEIRRYEATGNFHHHHLVCRSCLRVDEIDSFPLEATLQELKTIFATHKNFTEVTHNLEFFGLCAQCQ